MKTGRQLTDTGCSEDSRPVFFYNGRFIKAAPCKYPIVQNAADLAAQIGSHQFFDGFFRVTAAEEAVQFGDSGFGGHVAAADGVGCVQMAEEFLTAIG